MINDITARDDTVVVRCEPDPDAGLAPSYTFDVVEDDDGVYQAVEARDGMPPGHEDTLRADLNESGYVIR